jgi:hypothetical protein
MSNHRHETTKKDRTPVSGTVLDGFKTKRQLAAELHVTPRTLQDWINCGIGPRITMIGRFPYIAPPDLKQWLESRRQPMKKIA